MVRASQQIGVHQLLRNLPIRNAGGDSVWKRTSVGLPEIKNITFDRLTAGRGVYGSAFQRQLCQLLFPHISPGSKCFVYDEIHWRELMAKQYSTTVSKNQPQRAALDLEALPLSIFDVPQKISPVLQGAAKFILVVNPKVIDADSFATSLSIMLHEHSEFRIIVESSIWNYKQQAIFKHAMQRNDTYVAYSYITEDAWSGFVIAGAKGMLYYDEPAAILRDLEKVQHVSVPVKEKQSALLPGHPLIDRLVSKFEYIRSYQSTGTAPTLDRESMAGLQLVQILTPNISALTGSTRNAKVLIVAGDASSQLRRILSDHYDVHGNSPLKPNFHVLGEAVDPSARQSDKLQVVPFNKWNNYHFGHRESLQFIILAEPEDSIPDGVPPSGFMGKVGELLAPGGEIRIIVTGTTTARRSQMAIFARILENASISTRQYVIDRFVDESGEDPWSGILLVGRSRKHPPFDPLIDTEGMRYRPPVSYLTPQYGSSGGGYSRAPDRLVEVTPERNPKVPRM